MATGHPDQFFGGRTFAQHGDDLIVLCLFHSLGIEHPSFIDIGAHHPLNISNTALLYQRGSRGINVEPNPHLFAEFQKQRPRDVNLNIGVAPTAGTLTFYMIDDYSGRNTFSRETAEAFVAQNPQFSISKTAEIPVLPLNEIVSQNAAGVFPDFLTIDVEGLDLPIIEAADFSRSKPKIICIEVDNAKGAASKSAIHALLEEKGYICVMRAVSNLIFVEASLKKLLF